MQGVGEALAKSAFDLQQLQERTQRDLMNERSNRVSTELTRFFADQEKSFLEARDKSSASGIGFTASFMEGYQKRADDFATEYFSGMSSEAQTTYLNQIIGRGNSLYEKASAFESQAKAGYYDRTVNSSLDTVRTQIRNNAADFTELHKQGEIAIQSANMPDTWKTERLAMWKADAVASKYEWKYQQDPQTAIRDMRGIKVDTKGLAGAIQQTAQQLGIDPVDLATVMSYETGGTFDPWKKGPTTKWGTHRGLIQWGEPQAAKYGVTQDMPIEQQVAAAGRYLLDAGVKPGMGLIDIYSAVNAGAPGLYDRSDWKAGGAPGTVADKVMYQMEGHKQKAAALLGGTYQPTVGDPDLDAIPYERRQQIADEMQQDYSQKTTQQRAATADNYRLLIATDPDRVREDDILADPVLDNGDKAQLIGSLRTAVKDTGAVRDLVSALSAGDAPVNPFDPDQVKAANGAYDKLLSRATTPEDQRALTADFVSRTGYVPKKVQAELRNGAASSDPMLLAQSMEAGIQLDDLAQTSFRSFEGSDAVLKKLDMYRTLTRSMGYTPEQAAAKLVKANDPANVARRDALLKSDEVKKQIDKVTPDKIANLFDRGWFGQGVGSWNPELGATPAAQAVMVAEYKALFEEAIVDADGDLDAAEAAAGARFQRFYGPSQYSVAGNSVVIKNPIEKSYPVGGDGTHDYIRQQALEDLRAAGITADEVYLSPDLSTEKDIQAGRPPAYQLMFERDGKLELYPAYFVADVEAERLRSRATLDEQLGDARQRNKDLAARDGGTGLPSETFPNNGNYRGIARVGSPLERAMHRARQAEFDQAMKNKQADDEFVRTIEEQADNVGEVLKKVTPSVKIGGFSWNEDGLSIKD